MIAPMSTWQAASESQQAAYNGVFGCDSAAPALVLSRSCDTVTCNSVTNDLLVFDATLEKWGLLSESSWDFDGQVSETRQVHLLKTQVF